MKVLLLDTAFAALPIYDYLVSEGHEVWTIGNRSEDILARRAGARWIEQDYSDIAAVARHADRVGIERVVPGCTDVSIATAASLPIAEEWLDKPETVQKLSDKETFRALCHALDLPAPRALESGEIPTDGTWICKPVDAFSGRGISILNKVDATSFNAAVELARRASPTERYVVEEYVTGQLHSCTGFVENQRLVDTHYVIEGSSANPFAVDTSYVRNDVPEAARWSLEDGLSRLSAAIKLKDGLLHTQFILDGERIYIIECSRRCPGDLYSLLIEYSTGTCYGARYASYFVGGSPVGNGDLRRNVLRHTVTGDDLGFFVGLRARSTLPVIAYYPLQRVGEQVLPRQATRCGIAFLETPTSDSIEGMYQSFMERSVYDVLSANESSFARGNPVQ